MATSLYDYYHAMSRTSYWQPGLHPLDKVSVSARKWSRPARLRACPRTLRDVTMEMLNNHCGVTRDARGVVQVAICNAGSLNILGSPVTDAVREGLQQLSSDRSIRVAVLRGQSEKSMIGG